MQRDHQQTNAIGSITSALWDTNLVSSRLILGISEAIWALLLLWPGETFGRPTYTGMARVMPEEAWGLVFALSSVTQITIVIRRDFHCWPARYFAAWNMVLWVFVVTSMLMSVYPPPAAISAEIALALAAIWIWARPFLLLRGIEHAAARTQTPRL